MIPGKWSSKRYVIQFVALAFLVVIPLLNFYCNFSFFQGWYQSVGIGDLWIVSPLEGLESILVSRSLFGPLVVAMLIPVAIAVLMGRVFCGWICPIHFFSRIIEEIYRKTATKKYVRERWAIPRPVLFISLSVELGVTCILGAPIFVMLSPPGLVGREIMMVVFFGRFALEGIIVPLTLLLNGLSRNYFCRYFCPLGALLALLGKKRILNVVTLAGGCTSCGKCRKSCPFGLHAGEGEGESMYCCSCGSCIDSCPHGRLGFSLKNVNRAGSNQ